MTAAATRSIPLVLEEAATMVGASTWGIFRRIISPLITPMNATVGILTCLWAWNALVILSDPAARELPLAQYVFQIQLNTNDTKAFVSYLMARAPLPSSTSWHSAG